MKTLFPLLALLVPVLKAETLVVLSGNSIQEKIDAASDGDIIAIFGGTYNQNIIVNKKVRLVELAGQDVYITGAVTFTDLEETPPFQGFRVAGINIRGTKGLVIKDVDCDGGLTLWGNGVPDVSVVGGSQGSVTQRAGSLVTNSTTTDSFTVDSGADKTIAFRTIVKDTCNWGGNGAKGWFGYGEAKRINLAGESSKYVLIGNRVVTEGNTAISLGGNSSDYSIINNVLTGVFQLSNPVPPQHSVIYANFSDGNLSIQNNYLSLRARNQGYEYYPIYLGDSPAKSDISGNLISFGYDTGGGYDHRIVIRAPFGVTATHNHLILPRPRTSNVSEAFGRGGVTVTDTTYEDSAKLADYILNDDPFQIIENGFLKNQGDTNPQKNDRDGSRNDIGPLGGSRYDPEGWTTENPVVISFDLSPDQVLEGVNDEVEISEIQAISAP
ncbi:hypothetical protein N8545_02335 [bacterium]|nr:hypothetical protein [bacterium]